MGRDGNGQTYLSWTSNMKTPSEFVRQKFLPKIQTIMSKLQQTRNLETLKMCILKKERKGCDIIHKHRFAEANAERADTNSTQELCMTQKCPHFLPAPSLHSPVLKHQKASLMSFLKLCRTNTTHGKLPSEALTFQSL